MRLPKMDPAEREGMTLTAKHIRDTLISSYGIVNAAKILSRVHARLERMKRHGHKHDFLSEDAMQTIIDEESAAVMGGTK